MTNALEIISFPLPSIEIQWEATLFLTLFQVLYYPCTWLEFLKSPLSFNCLELSSNTIEQVGDLQQYTLDWENTEGVLTQDLLLLGACACGISAHEEDAME